MVRGMLLRTAETLVSDSPALSCFYEQSALPQLRHRDVDGLVLKLYSRRGGRTFLFWV